MEVHFRRVDDRLWHRKRDVRTVPSVGDQVVWHEEGASTTYRVIHVTHAYDDREWYRSRAEFGDRVWVTLAVHVENPSANEAWLRAHDTHVPALSGSEAHDG